MCVYCRIVHLLISKTGCCQIFHYSKDFQDEIDLQNNSFGSSKQQSLFTLEFVFQYTLGFDYDFLV